MNYVWDRRKGRSNLTRHGIAFEDAIEAHWREVIRGWWTGLVTAIGPANQFGVRGDLPAVPSKCQQQFPVQVGARELIWASFRYRIPNQSRTGAGNCC